MDLTPSMAAAQELLETLSQRSGSTGPTNKTGGSGGNSSSQKNSGSSSSQKSGSVASSEERLKYRRLGQQLSEKAHDGSVTAGSGSVTGGVGDGTHSQASIPTPLAAHPRSSFVPFKVAQSLLVAAAAADANNNNNNTSILRTQKVAKTRYSDHGQHYTTTVNTGQSNLQISTATTTTHQHQQQYGVSVLKKVTMRSKELFNLCEANTEARQQADIRIREQQQQQQHLKPAQDTNEATSDDNAVSQQQHALSNLDLDREAKDTLGGLRWEHGTSLMAQSTSKGLLSAVLEGHSDSQTSGGPNEHSTHNSPASQSISTKDSKTLSSLGGFAQGSTTGSQASIPVQDTVRGACLTEPSDPVRNGGIDNCEGNMIAYENDIILVPRKSIHTISSNDSDRPKRSAEYRIQGMLGKGTFAQVFRCVHIQSGRMVALKVVKNTPAYTRQATVEIDVFRALREEESKSDGGSSGDSSSGSPSPGHKDCILNLLCYFMYRSHLCLVFEMLGLNLYEVLKKRQLLGLPLSVVQTIVKQSLWGMRELSKKNVVHCDLKPENILLVSDKVVDEIVASGDNQNRIVGGSDQITTASTPSATSLSMSGSGTQSSMSGTSSGGGSQTRSSRSGISSGGGSGSQTRSSMSGGSSGGRASSSGMQSNQSSGATNSTVQATNVSSDRKIIKLIDFGSACFEGFTSHSYIQSRFYRSPEVLVGLPYDSAIDVWSLGCVAAELFLGLPILPGVHEHDQLSRISEMIAKLPDWMLEQGSRTSKYFLKYVVPRSSTERSSPALHQQTPSPHGSGSPIPTPSLPQWRMKTPKEYIKGLSMAEIRKKGGQARLEKAPGNKYFKRKRLVDILVLQAQSVPREGRTLLPAFVHFLYGILDPDPWKRWTAFQVLQHPFVTGDLSKLKSKAPDKQVDPKTVNQANRDLDLYWEPPWDPSICKRKLLNVQKIREKQQAQRKSMSGRSSSGGVHDSTVGSRRHRREQNMGLEGGAPSVVSAAEDTGHGIAAGESPHLSSASNLGSSASTSTSSQPFANFSSRVPSRAGSATFSDQTGINQTGNRVQLSSMASVASNASVPNSTFSMPSQAKSFNDPVYGGRDPSFDLDFAYALKRPGVVPGSGFDSVTSKGSYQGSVHNLPQGSISPSQQHGLPFTNNRYPHHHQQSVDPRGHGSTRGIPGAPTISVHRPPNDAASFDSSMAFGAPYQLDASVAPSVSSSVTMSEAAAPILDPHQFAVLQQQQLLFLQQQQQQLSMGMHQMPHPQQSQQFIPTHGAGQPHSGGVGVTPTAGASVAPDGSQQLFPQQQPLIMTQAPGGGYYYVTTAANGQPILLQPVGMLNHPQQPAGQLPTPHLQHQQQQPLYPGSTGSVADVQPSVMIPPHHPQQLPHNAAYLQPPVMAQPNFPQHQQQQHQQHQQVFGGHPPADLRPNQYQPPNSSRRSRHSRGGTSM